MRILLFGSSGAVGTAISAVLPRHGFEVVELRHDQVEATDPAAVRDAIRRVAPDGVVNAVARIGNVPCEADPAGAFAVNAVAVYHLANACQEARATLVHFGTHAVFDGTKEGPYTEEDVPRPINVYAAAKLAGEQFALNLCERAYVFRLPTLFGPRRNGGAGFVDKMLARARAGLPLRIASDRIDSPTYTMDTAERVARSLRERLPFGLYHVANAGRVSFYDFIRRLMGFAGLAVEVSPAREEEFDVPGRRPLRTSMRSVRLPSLRSWEEALEAYVAEHLRSGRAAPAGGVR